jgi:hypothetical protein
MKEKKIRMKSKIIATKCFNLQIFEKNVNDIRIAEQVHSKKLIFVI